MIADCWNPNAKRSDSLTHDHSTPEETCVLMVANRFLGRPILNVAKNLQPIVKMKRWNCSFSHSREQVNNTFAAFTAPVKKISPRLHKPLEPLMLRVRRT